MAFEKGDIGIILFGMILVVVSIPFLMGEDQIWQLSQGLDVADKAFFIFQTDVSDVNENITASVPNDKAYIIPGAGIQIDSFFGNDTIKITNTGGAGGGEANTASNLSGDQGIFAQKNGVDLEFKALSDGSGITLSSDANAVTIAVDGTVLTTASNFEDLANVSGGCTDGQIKEFDSGSSTWICVTPSAGDMISEGDSNVEVIDAGTGQVDIDVDNANQVTITATTIDLQGNNLIDGVIDGDTITVQDLALGAEVTGASTDLTDTTDIVRDSDVINKLNNVNHGTCTNGQQLTWNTGTSQWICGNDQTGADENTSAVNVGSGVGVFDLESGDELQFNSLIGGSGIDVTDTTQDLTIAVDGTVIVESDNINALNDVTATGCSDEEVLEWDTGTSKWICGTDDICRAPAGALQISFECGGGHNPTAWRAIGRKWKLFG